jgi:cell wall-associated NlpC family hydrolase
VASAVVAGLLLAASHRHALPGSGAAASTAPSPAAATAVAFARAQLGKPYVYGATGPDGFDCSGLVQAAWAAAGVSIPRTSEQQWTGLPHVSQDQLHPGDLVFYTGSPIDPPPGHVTMYAGGGQMIEAYGTGVPIRVTGLRSGAWGYARPGAS